jgi:excisionase family DNA binding protein
MATNVPSKRMKSLLESQPLALTVPETALSLGICRSAVYALVKAGRLRFVRLAGGSIRIPREAIGEFLNESADDK